MGIKERGHPKGGGLGIRLTKTNTGAGSSELGKIIEAGGG